MTKRGVRALERIADALERLATAVRPGDEYDRAHVRVRDVGDDQ